MPLDAYGVLVGGLTRWVRDTPDTLGRWYHVNLTVRAPGGTSGVIRSYRCAVDVDSKASAVGVQWKLLRFTKESLGPPATHAPGYHTLNTNDSSGALDLIRHPTIREAHGCLRVLGPLLNRFRRSWISGSHEDASVALESILEVDATVYVFGEPFTNGFGMHNVHQNQGDPSGSQWWHENGVWQDGGVLVARRDGSFDAFVSKFSTQTDRTDNDGHPA